MANIQCTKFGASTTFIAFKSRNVELRLHHLLLAVALPNTSPLDWSISTLKKVRRYMDLKATQNFYRLK